MDVSAALDDVRPFGAVRALRPLAVPTAVPLRLEVVGSMRMQRGGLPLPAIGGPKAGTNQALGLFAFLFDRDTRGVDKDEALELIWPEASMPVADTAFHRTMLGLRRTLAGDGQGEVIAFRTGRYFLDESIVASSDLADLEDLLEASGTVTDPRARIALLERCRALDRGPYMDDCPYYGTSTFVEVRRTLVRSVMTAVLRELGDLYEASGHLALAAMRRAEVGPVPDSPSQWRRGG